MSNLVNHAKRFDADVSRVQRAFIRLSKVIAATQRELDMYKQERHRDNVLWQHYLKEHRRLVRRRREIWLCKLLPWSLFLLVVATCRAIVSGAVWLLHYSGRLILIRSSALATGTRLFPANEARGIKLVRLGPAAAIAAAALVSVGVFAPSRSIAPVEIVLPIRPDAQGPATFTAAKGKLLQGRAATLPAPHAAPGFAPVSVSSEAAFQPMPGPGQDVMILPTKPLPAPDITSSISDVTPTAVPKPRPQPRTATPSTLSPATAVAPAPAIPRKAASAVLKPVAETPEPTSEPPQSQKTSPARGRERRDFVPHAFW